MSEMADDLLRFIDASPSPYHAVAESARRLRDAGYQELHEGDAWELASGARFFVVRGDGSLAAFVLGTAPAATAGLRLVGAHTDSPNLRVKPEPAVSAHGYGQLAVEVYGGVLLHTWLDRDLSVAGRVAVDHDGQVRTALVDLERPVARIPSLAIHLDRTVNTDGLQLNAQQHLVPIVGLGGLDADAFRAMLAAGMGNVDPGAILGWDLCLYDVQRAARGGAHGELLHAARLDNLASCHAALLALLGSEMESTAHGRGIVLYDHEEVGSRSARGAASPFLRSLLERIVVAGADCTPESFARAMARSFLVSADMAHAVHPNHADKHEPGHRPVLGGGPVVKVHASQAYATDAASWGRFERLCREVDVPCQRFVSRNDLACGSTIGPIAAAELGIPTVDVGNPMLSMHSCREMAAAADVPRMLTVLERFFTAP
jgi:aspartyl aminopeptidase